MDIPYKVIADKKKNRLYIDLYLTEPGQAEKIVDEIWEKAKQLTVGWGCIVNYTEIDVQLTKDLLEKAEDVMSFLRPLGMGQLVRVLTEEQSSLNDELKQRSLEIGGYEGIVARNTHDADTILDCVQDHLSYPILKNY
jgi:hypothetical protein